MAIISFVIFPLFRKVLRTLCRKMASSFFSSRGALGKNLPLTMITDIVIIET